MTRSVLLTLSLCMLLAGCNQPKARLNAPPHGAPYKTHDLQSTYVYMNDNALLENMTVCDMHFLPHRAALNALGIERLSRLAALLEAYGGTVRFDSDLTDEALLSARTTTVREFLAEAGIDTTSEVLVRDISGGEGGSAAEAVLIKSQVGTFKPKKDGGSSEQASPEKSTK